MVCDGNIKLAVADLFVLCINQVIALALPPCAKHREGDQKLRFWWWVVLFPLRFSKIEQL